VKKVWCAAVAWLAMGSALSGQAPTSPPESSPVIFRDITQKAGIHFVHNNAAFGKKYLPETMGPGVAFIDCDNDG
jgi:enediyne biosynthesis protein E4